MLPPNLSLWGKLASGWLVEQSRERPFTQKFGHIRNVANLPTPPCLGFPSAGSAGSVVFQAAVRSDIEINAHGCIMSAPHGTIK